MSREHPVRLWIAALALGWLFDFLFWKQETGLNFTLFLVSCMLVGFGILLAKGFRPAAKSLWLLVPFAFFATITFLRREPLTLFPAYTFTLFPIGVLANTYLGGRWPQYGLAEYLIRFFLILGSAFLPFPAPSSMLASWGFAVSLTPVNVDASITEHNLERVANGKNLNAPDFALLFTNAISALAEEFQNPRKTTKQREGIGAILTCYIHTDMRTVSDDWRSWNLSRWQAKQIIKTLQPLLDGCRYNKKKLLARTPSGVYYEW